MNSAALSWSQIPWPIPVLVALAVLAVGGSLALPHLRRWRHRRWMRRLPPPPRKVEVEERDLRLPRRAGNDDDDPLA